MGETRVCFHCGTNFTSSPESIKRLEETIIEQLQRAHKVTVEALQAELVEKNLEIEKLKSERDFYRRGRDWLQGRCSIAEENEAKLGVDLNDLRSLLAKKDEALKYYADKSNWDAQYRNGRHNTINLDEESEPHDFITYGGKRARQALAEMEKQK